MGVTPIFTATHSMGSCEIQPRCSCARWRSGRHAERFCGYLAMRVSGVASSAARRGLWAVGGGMGRKGAGCGAEGGSGRGAGKREGAAERKDGAMRRLAGKTKRRDARAQRRGEYFG